MMRVGLRDASFTTASMSGDLDAPKHFEWDRSESSVPRFYTDICLRQAKDAPHPRVAVLIEAPPFRAEFYDYVVQHEDEFDYILTYIRSLLETHDPRKWLFYPHCGTRVPLNEWGVFGDKHKRVSMIASNKDEATGHRLRHAIAARYGDRIDVMGSINGHYVSKHEGHAAYLYSIVVDAECNDWCFSDHLLDALALCTVPIYWGCPDIGKFFDAQGILPFAHIDELEGILGALSRDDYVARRPALVRNMEIATQYRIAEDWIYGHYPFLFEGLS